MGLTTILGHITVLAENGKISKEKKQELLSPLELPSQITEWIKQGEKLDSLKQLKQYMYLYEYLNKENS
ncbi:MAG: Uncharacterised protein [Arcobacter lacus]|nr:MAG: Uncharacterised protein [Arcobacter lacus]